MKMSFQQRQRVMELEHLSSEDLAEMVVAAEIKTEYAAEVAAMLLSMYQHVSHGGPTREQAAALLEKIGLLPPGPIDPPPYTEPKGYA